MACLAAKPIVDGIEKDLDGRAKVIRLDMLSKIGREIAARYGVQSLPTLLVVDADSKEIYRETGMPNRRKVVALATAP